MCGEVRYGRLGVGGAEGVGVRYVIGMGVWKDLGGIMGVWEHMWG